jgi:hypothetical protein
MASRRSTDPTRPEGAPARAKPSPAARSPRKKPLSQPPPLTPEARHELIAVGAYLRAERRGFAHGHAEEDWLAAEAEVDALLRVSPGGSSQ